ncbi:MAG: carboxypeptidase-like regulatory domain-containing protein [Cyclobacteriaceae bacterium]|nr:carboxypeptidase-like regulatory domain-containing protein [Cyclobacteriaceae bacterium]
MKIFFKSLLVVFLLPGYAFSQIEENRVPFDPIRPTVSILTGKVIDRNTGAGVSYTNVKLSKKTFSVESDEAGLFTLGIDSLTMTDSIEFTRLGYKPLKLFVGNLLRLQKVEVKMEEQSVVLPEIIVAQSGNLTARKIVEQVIDSISKNYINQPFLMESKIYKKFPLENSGLFISKISGSIYFASGYQDDNRNDNILLDTACIMKYDSVGRRWTKQNQNKDQLFYNLVGLFLRDLVAYRQNNFLNKKNLDKYEFDIESINERKILIRFRSLSMKLGVVPYSNLASYSGTIEVDRKRLTIVKLAATATIDRKVMTKSTGKEATGRMETITEYSLQKDGKYFWHKSSYKDNFYQETEIINVNTFTKIGKQSIPKRSWESARYGCN